MTMCAVSSLNQGILINSHPLRVNTSYPCPNCQYGSCFQNLCSLSLLPYSSFIPACTHPFYYTGNVYDDYEPMSTLRCPRSFHHQNFSACFCPGNMFSDVWTYRNRTEMTDKLVPM